MTRVNDDLPGAHLPLRGAIFDFNGTLSDDEGLLYEIYLDLFREQLGYELTKDDYFTTLAGLSDPEIILEVLKRIKGADNRALATYLLDTKVKRYCAEVAIAPRIAVEAADFVRAIADIVPVAVATGAARVEVHAALKAAGIFDSFSTIVTAEDVQLGKPDPEGFLIAARVLKARIEDQGEKYDPNVIAVFEDSSFGLLAAKSAGMFPVVVASPVPQFAAGSLTIPSLSGASLDLVLPLFCSHSPQSTGRLSSEVPDPR